VERKNKPGPDVHTVIWTPNPNGSKSKGKQEENKKVIAK
jgi:hypothetical protein